MSDNPQGPGPQGPDPQNPYAQGVPGQPQPGAGGQPGYPPQPGAGGQPPAYGAPGGGQPGYPQQPPAYGAPGGGQPSYPQQPPAYGAPGGGQPGYPPPGGFPTAPPPSDPYGAPGPYGSPGTGPLSVGETVRFAWSTLFANFGSWLLMALIMVAFNALWTWITGGFETYRDALDGNSISMSVGFSGLTFVWTILGMIISYFITALFVRGSLDEAAGRRPGVGDFFKLSNIGGIIVASLLVGLMIDVGIAACILPGIILAIFTVFTLYFVLDRGQNGIQAIGSSFSVVSKNFGEVLVILLTFIGINIVGALLCGLGLLITIPMTYIAMGYAYRRLAARGAF